jgi:hypothetical protein
VTVRHVRQEDASGCMVACLAMVTGRSYAEIRQYFVEHGRTFEGGDGAGITEFDAEFYLADLGFAIARKYRWRWANVQRSEWPTPPFAPVHILGVRGSGAHGVVLLPDRTVLDLFIDSPRTLADYPEIAYMIGVFAVVDGKAVA